MRPPPCCMLRQHAAPARCCALQKRGTECANWRLWGSLRCCTRCLAFHARAWPASAFVCHSRARCAPAHAAASVAGCGCAAAPTACTVRGCVAALTLPPLLSPPCCCECAQDNATPLHGAAHNGHDACVTLLVQRCATMAAKNEVRCPDACTTPCSLTPSAFFPPLCCVVMDASSEATRRCILPHGTATLLASSGWLRAAQIRRQRTRCAALLPPPLLCAACVRCHAHCRCCARCLRWLFGVPPPADARCCLRCSHDY
jgi:hypothetical protein